MSNFIRRHCLDLVWWALTTQEPNARLGCRVKCAASALRAGFSRTSDAGGFVD